MKEMRRLGGSWNAAIHAAQRSIEADTAWTGRTRGMLLRAWLRPTARGLSLSRYLRRMPGDDLLAVDEHPAPAQYLGGGERGDRAGPRDPVPDGGKSLA